MPSQPFITEFHVRNYRVLRDFQISGLRRLNVVGGLNGSGKSTLLESIFTFLDQGGFTPVTRPFMFRQVPTSLETARKVIAGEAGEFELKANTRLGKLKMSVKWEPQFIGAPLQVSPPQMAEGGSSPLPSTGITVTGHRDEGVIWRRHFADANQGIVLSEEIQFALQMPPSVILSRYTSHYPNDIVSRFSNAITSGKKKDLIRSLNEIITGIEDLLIANFAGQPAVHAQFEGDVFVPVSFIGDGALTLLSIATSIIESKGGCVLLDEFDAAIHYSKLKIIWAEIYALASKYDCQIFAATHSKESLAAITELMSEKNHNDFAYFRLDRDKDKIVSTRYDYNALDSSLEQDWDVR